MNRSYEKWVFKLQYSNDYPSLSTYYVTSSSSSDRHNGCLNFVVVKDTDILGDISNDLMWHENVCGFYQWHNQNDC